MVPAKKKTKYKTKKDPKLNKNIFFKYICNTRMVMENLHPLFVAGGTKDEDKRSQPSIVSGEIQIGYYEDFIKQVIHH